jgi:predicted  nucleic acid-binding Zn-ribbon protein
MVVLFLLLAIAGLTLGILLFNRREILKGRTQQLEKTIIKLGTLTEAEPAKLDEKPKYIAKDVADCTSTILEEPETSPFWNTYKHELEVLDQPFMDLNKKKMQLMTYFQLDPRGDVKYDDYNRKMTDGPDTMKAVLDDLVTRSQAQLNRLNETRSQLKALREELVSTIETLNKTKKDLRTALNTIVQKDQKIAELEGKIAQLKTQIETLENEKRDLQSQIADLNKEIKDLKQELDNKKTEITKLKDEIKRLRDDLQERIKNSGEKADQVYSMAGRVSPGTKGKVISINSEYRFALVEISDEFMKEILGENLNQVIPFINLQVKRPGDKGEFVTKVHLVQIKASQKIAVVDILGDWQQRPLEIGDVVFY